MDDWGGSEELWAKSIPMINNSSITVYKSKINFLHAEFVKLKLAGATFIELEPKLSFSNKATRKLKQLYQRILTNNFTDNHALNKFRASIKDNKPDLVIIAQGINFDGLIYAYECFRLNISYVIIAQKAVDFFWPYHTDRSYMKETLLRAKMNFFVSNHNKQLTEEQFGIRLPNSKIVFNPVKTNVTPLPFPTTSKGYQLACVARLFIIDKGQDILLRIMNKEKWRTRPITISFIGSGLDEEGLKEMAKLLNINNVKFIGYLDNVENVWAEHHALVLPSRSEGLPLSMIEAMSVGRPVIVSNAGGNADIIEDGINGFIAEATERDFELAMDRAWEKREEWKKIGEQASLHISKHIPSSPETVFANYLNDLIDEH
ncbi:glycosyltransferase family 4 protein [Pedobacter sp. V48]|uniref:glycosyltransferase family 4 protein n=1 Tax=Pedobacter sp. V48 TaxID=509635 RepID=UPI0004B18E75|nr:glycosyltransferase family 4 protein [Pedobacter sp. V48]